VGRGMKGRRGEGIKGFLSQKRGRGKERRGQEGRGGERDGDEK